MSLTDGSGGGSNNQLLGNQEDNTLTGTDAAETIAGFAGNDQLFGAAQNDWLIGDAGADTLDGGEGDDTLQGGDDSDSLRGGTGNDTIEAGGGDDSAQGGEGDDLIFGGVGSDSLDGGTGDDQLEGAEGNDALQGAEGNDTLFAGTGRDTLNGGDGNDHLQGDEGDDSLQGAAGSDTLFAGPGRDTLRGGDGNDRLYSYGNSGLVIDDGKLLAGENGDDSIVGGAGNDTAQGGSGRDTIQGDAGQDTLIGNGDDDLIFGDAGNDALQGDAGQDTLQGDEGDDSLDGGEGDDTLVGGLGHDTLISGSGLDLLNGGDGNDHYVIGSPFAQIVEQSGEADSAHVAVDFFKRPSGLESFVLQPGVARLPYWIDALIPSEASGHAFAALLGDSRQVGYAFPPTLPGYITSTANVDGREFAPFTSAQVNAAHQAFGYLQTVVNLRFIATDIADAVNVIALANNRQDQSAGYARYPSQSREGSDVFLSIAPEQQNGDPIAGTYGALTLIHEISHALGLKHPFADQDHPDNAEAVLPSADETVRWTVMTYNNQSEADKAFWAPQLRPLDIAALHYLYGPSPETRAGNDTYAVGAHDPARTDDIRLISPEQPNFIWDGGGYDTIDATQSTRAVAVSLEPGYRGWITAWAASITAPGQITVNFGTQIESLTGSAFSDQLFGNALDNRIDGGSGNDQIASGGGLDQLFGGLGNDTLSGGDGNDTVTGGPGADQMSGNAGDDRFEAVGSGDRVWGGPGSDEARFDAPSSQFRARRADTADGSQWRIEKADTGWVTATLSSVERLVFSDRTITLDELASGALSSAGTGLVWHWSSHVALTAANASAPLAPMQGSLAARSIDAADVLAALKLATGRPLTASAGSTPAVDPAIGLKRLAADLDQDGAIESTDVAGIVHLALQGQAISEAPWLFVPENTNLDALNDSAGAAFGLVQANALPSAASSNWIAVLRGDVDGSWRPPPSSEAVTLPEEYLRSLADPLPISPRLWGFADQVMQPAIELSVQLDPLMSG